MVKLWCLWVYMIHDEQVYSVETISAPLIPIVIFVCCFPECGL